MLDNRIFFPVLAAFFVSVLFLPNSGDGKSYIAYGNPNKVELPDDISFDFSVSIYVDTYDFTKKSASLSIQIIITNCNYPNATAITVVFEGDAHPFVDCAIVNEALYYGNEGIEWPLFGNGESYPFDSYRLRFTISRSFYFVVDNLNYYITPNATLSQVYSPSGINIVEPSSELYVSEFFITIERSSLIPSYQLLLPILLCYFMLGGSLIIGKSQLAVRMRVYLSLFVFSPTFLFAIQSYLPYRLSLCIPEILLVNVLTSTAIFSFSSMVSLKVTKTTYASILDILALCVSIALLIALYGPMLSFKTSFEILAILIVAIVGNSIGLILRFLIHIYGRFRKEDSTE